MVCSVTIMLKPDVSMYVAEWHCHGRNTVAWNACWYNQKKKKKVKNSFSISTQWKYYIHLDVDVERVIHSMSARNFVYIFVVVYTCTYYIIRQSFWWFFFFVALLSLSLALSLALPLYSSFSRPCLALHFTAYSQAMVLVHTANSRCCNGHTHIHATLTTHITLQAFRHWLSRVPPFCPCPYFTEKKIPFSMPYPYNIPQCLFHLLLANSADNNSVCIGCFPSSACGLCVRVFFMGMVRTERYTNVFSLPV